VPVATYLHGVTYSAWLSFEEPNPFGHLRPQIIGDIAIVPLGTIAMITGPGYDGTYNEAKEYNIYINADGQVCVDFVRNVMHRYWENIFTDLNRNTLYSYQSFSVVGYYPYAQVTVNYLGSYNPVLLGLGTYTIGTTYSYYDEYYGGSSRVFRVQYPFRIGILKRGRDWWRWREVASVPHTAGTAYFVDGSSLANGVILIKQYGITNTPPLYLDGTGIYGSRFYIKLYSTHAYCPITDEVREIFVADL
jgi:hypothetical protein